LLGPVIASSPTAQTGIDSIPAPKFVETLAVIDHGHHGCVIVAKRLGWGFRVLRYQAVTWVEGGSGRRLPCPSSGCDRHPILDIAFVIYLRGATTASDVTIGRGSRRLGVCRPC